MLNRIINKIKFELQFKNTHYYVRVTEKLSKMMYKRILKSRINRIPPLITKADDAKLTVAILSNKTNFYESVAALYSFCSLVKNVVIHYHEDGTLTQTEVDVLKRVLPAAVFFKRAEQDKKVNTYLLENKLPGCAKIRKHFLFAIRSFDMIIEKKTPYLLQMDSDVLFFSEPVELLEIIQKQNFNGCYNKDVSNSYTFDEPAMKRLLPVPVVNNFNAGVFMHNFDSDFFAFAEDVLQQEPWAGESWHLEQTLFAMYVTLKGNFLELPKQYDLARHEWRLGNKLTSEHYVHGPGFDFQKDFIYKLYPLYKKSQAN